jgi:hypothetical protein
MHRIFLYMTCVIILFACDQTKQTKLSNGNSMAYSGSDSLTRLLHQITSIPARSNSGRSTCGDSSYWKIVQSGKRLVPLLIGRLSDTSETEIRIACYNGSLKVGHLAFLLLEEICPFPIAAETGMQFDSFDEGCPFGYGFLEYIDRNPIGFKEIVSRWYVRNAKIYSWQSTHDSCALQNNVRGYWAIPH